jgi:hypothetical protein
VKKLNKTVLLAAVLASAANAGLSITGDATVGLKYYTKETTANGTNDNHFVVESGNDNQGLTHINFSATDGGKSGKGAYAFVETAFDVTDASPDFTIGGAYVGYNANKFDVRLGTLDSLTYQWVGSMNEQMHFSDNIAIAPVNEQEASNSIQFLSKLGSVTLGAQARLTNDKNDYDSIDLGAKFDIGSLEAAVVHQTANDGRSTAAQPQIFQRDTTAVSLGYALKHLTSSKLLKDLELMATYADYSEQTVAASGKQSEDSSYSVGAKLNNTSILYQTGISQDQERINIQHERPLSKNAAFGLEAQLGTKNYYAIATNGSQNTTATRDNEFVVAYLTMNF